MNTNDRDHAEQWSRYKLAVEEYYLACNSGDADRIARCFTENAVHYFPEGVYQGPFVGSETIASRWSQAVRDWGSIWYVDELIIDPERDVAVLEWTHHKVRQSVVLRGTEWILFDPSSAAIKEVRAYYAAPQPPTSTQVELGGFLYQERGYFTADDA